MTTIPLTPAMYAMLARAGARADGSIETKKQTAAALRARGLAVVAPLSSGRVGVITTELGRRRLAEAQSEETGTARPLIRWERGRYSSIRGDVGKVSDIVSISSSTNTSKPGFYLDCKLFVVSRERYVTEDAAKAAAEVAFRAWIAKLGLQPIAGGA
jgi:hypothetical protein